MNEARVMTFREHLGELRTRLVRVIAVLLVGFLVGWQFRVEIFTFLASPIIEALADNGIYHFQAIHLTESVVVYMKTSAVAALVALSPYVFYELWAFVGPGLLARERRFLVPVAAFSAIFFIIGVGFAYQVILPFITDWLVNLAQEDAPVEVMVTLQNAFSTAFVFMALFGMVFELPLVIFFLALLGIVTHTSLLRFFRFFVVIAFVAAAALTPPDPISQIMLAVPLVLLYGFGIAVAFVVARTRARTADDPDASVGAHALRLMAGGLVLAAIAVGLAVWLVEQLPAKAPTAYLPLDTAWVLSANPAVLGDQEPELVDALLAGDDALTRLVGAFRAADVPLEDVTRALLVGTRDGSRALVVSADGLGERRAELSAALAAEATEEATAPPAPAKALPAQPASTQTAPTRTAPSKPPTAQTGPARPAPTQRAPTQPPMAQTAPAQPAPAQPPTAQTGPAQPAPAQPPTTQPAPTQPPTTQPAPAQPGPAQPAPTRPAPMPTLSVAALDGDTLAIGPRALLDALAAGAAGDAAVIQPSNEERRLLTRLRGSAPLWAWLPNPAEHGEPLLGEGSATGVLAAGGYLALGDEPRLTLELRAAEQSDGDRLEARLDAARVEGRSDHLDEGQRQLLAAIERLAAELKRDADPDRRAAVELIEADLRREAGQPETPVVPVVARVGRYASGWAIRRKDGWLSMTTELADDGARGVLRLVLAAPGN